MELPKFTPKTIVEKKMAVLWLRFLTEIGEKHTGAPAELLANELTSKALGIVEKSAMSDAQLHAYERFWMAVHDEQAYLEGRYIKGREEGRAEGREEGRAEGREEGRNNEKLDTARRMKSDGMPDEMIAKYTGLAIEEVKGL